MKNFKKIFQNTESDLRVVEIPPRINDFVDFNISLPSFITATVDDISLGTICTLEQTTPIIK